ncbi:MAG: hypothetical protein QF903_00295 [Planctomycetota bacterium]|nr:hypothetical protein [Planctomycetota bacterium]MDP6761280.1 hypothetical protein [Planctomycetota bacterium]MDP6987898.1 hypothetical protein [Planctomycetota bacterium]
MAEALQDGEQAGFDTISHAGEVTTYAAGAEGGLRMAQFEEAGRFRSLCICIP